MPSPLFARKPVSLLLAEMEGEQRLRRVLGPMALTSLGIGCILLLATNRQSLLKDSPWLRQLSQVSIFPGPDHGAVHPKFRTPWKATILAGILVSVLAGLLPLRILAELVNIGTLLAFVIVCAAVLVLRRTDPEAPRSFRVPLVPVVPVLGILLCLLLMFSLPAENWLRLVVWLVIGLVVYFGYGRKHSVMARIRAGETITPARP